MFDNDFFKAYRRWITQFNDLTDCAFFSDDFGEQRDRWRASELERFRNDRCQYVERDVAGSRWPLKLFKGKYAPTGDRLAAHTITQGAKTIWMSNSPSGYVRKQSVQFDRLLMLIDIDNKEGTAKVDDAARHVLNAYLNGRGYVEPSTGGLGRHVYFVLEVDADDSFAFDWAYVWEVMDAFGARVKADPAFTGFGVTFDKVVYGQPTLWKKQPDKSYRVARRGTLVKLPYCPNDWADLKALMALEPIPLNGLAGAVRRQRPEDRDAPTAEGGTRGKDDLRVTHARPCVPDDVSDTDAFTKKRLCIDRLLQRTNGQCSVDDVLNDYHANWQPSGMTAKDVTKRRREFVRMFRARLKTFRPSTGHQHAFKRDEYLPLIQSLNIPDDAFVWHRREKIDCRRLSDFVSVKLQDAFFDPDDRQVKGYFATATRDATISNMRVMKAKGVVDWIANAHTYKRLLEVATKYRLLHVYEDFVPPKKSKAGQTVFKGTGRMIGPGDALPDLKAKWLKLYAAWKDRQATDLLAA